MTWNLDAFKERLQMARERHKPEPWSERDLAKAAGLSTNRITRLKQSPMLAARMAEIVRLASALEVRPCWLAFDDSLETMDDEERDLVDSYRRLPEPERAPLQEMLKSRVANLPPTKPLGRRTPRASQVGSQLRGPKAGLRLSPDAAAQLYVALCNMPQVEFDGFSVAPAIVAHLQRIIDAQDLPSNLDCTSAASDSAADNGSSVESDNANSVDSAETP